MHQALGICIYVTLTLSVFRLYAFSWIRLFSFLRHVRTVSQVSTTSFLIVVTRTHSNENFKQALMHSDGSLTHARAHAQHI